jgi:tetratricopeptide (TPR) repeat protein
MSLDSSNPFTKAAIQVAFAGLGVALAGPLGGALGGVIGNVLGDAAADLVKTCTDKIGEEAARKLADTGAESLIERLKKSAPDLQSAYRQALRQSLCEIRNQSDPSFEEWFSNWDVCLKTSVPLNLAEIRAEQLNQENLESLFRSTMERLDAQGKAIQQRSQSLNLQTRSAPDPLIARIVTRLPEHFKENFRALIVTDEYKMAWNQAELAFRDYQRALLARIDENTSKTREMVEVLYAKAVHEGRIVEQRIREKDEEIERLTRELMKIKEHIASRSSEPPEAEFGKFLEEGDFDSAVRLKSKQVEERRKQAGELPRDLFELGILYELQFDLNRALPIYREAWRGSQNPEYGYQFACTARRLNQFDEAIGAFEKLLTIYKDESDRANTQNSLGVVYEETQRLRQAEQSYQAALQIYRKLARTNPGLYLSDVAMVLNNLAGLYVKTQRVRQAERALREALVYCRKTAKSDPYVLSEAATTLSNLGRLYTSTQRAKQAGEVLREALDIQTLLATLDPNAYMPDVARTLNNLGLLYEHTRRMDKAEQAYRDSLDAYRTLTESHPAAYRRFAADVLNNLANIYCDMHRRLEAERAYEEALSIYRELSAVGPDVYQPFVATVLTNLGLLYAETNRMDKAEEAYAEALSIRRTLAGINPDAFLPDVVVTLFNLAALYNNTKRFKEAENAGQEAETILEPLWRENPLVHGDQMAMILRGRAILRRNRGDSYGEMYALATRALAAAKEPTLKKSMRATVEQLKQDSQE